MFKNKSNQSQDALAKSALEIIAEYSSALVSGDNLTMDSLRSQDFELDFVQRDAFDSSPLSNEETKTFWPDWFSAFPQRDYHITRTIAGEEVVVTQWAFSGTHLGPLSHPIFGEPIEATGKTICFRGISVYDVRNGLVCRETTYMDLSTLFVELDITV
jgi:steroid delta-isomerase-like uncharacterized protein